MKTPFVDLHQLPKYIDHTLLKPEAGCEAILRLCDEAQRFGFYGVCVNPVWVMVCRDALQGSPIAISAVCGFPLGAGMTDTKAYEAARAVERGAVEIDMVLPIGLLMEGDEAAVRADIAAVVQAVRGGAIVKVIMETGLLSDERKIAACRLACEAGAHFVKTSTGFGPGGATEADVRLLRDHVPAEMKVKASGGIRDLDTALRMIEAGAERLGTSSGVAIMSGIQSGGGY